MPLKECRQHFKVALADLLQSSRVTAAGLLLSTDRGTLAARAKRVVPGLVCRGGGLHPPSKHRWQHMALQAIGHALLLGLLACGACHIAHPAADVGTHSRAPGRVQPRGAGPAPAPALRLQPRLRRLCPAKLSRPVPTFMQRSISSGSRSFGHRAKRHGTRSADRIKFDRPPLLPGCEGPSAFSPHPWLWSGRWRGGRVGCRASYPLSPPHLNPKP